MLYTSSQEFSSINNNVIKNNKINTKYDGKTFRVSGHKNGEPFSYKLNKKQMSKLKKPLKPIYTNFDEFNILNDDFFKEVSIKPVKKKTKKSKKKNKKTRRKKN